MKLVSKSRGDVGKQLSEGTQRSAKLMFGELDCSTLRDDADYKDLVELEKHEKFAARLHEECYKDLRECKDAGKVVCVIDWAGKVEARSHRQNNPEYFHPAKLEMLGALVSVADLEGGRLLTYIHAYDLTKVAGKKKNGYRTAAAMEEVVAAAKETYRSIHKRVPNKLDIWMDTGRHFRNKLVMYHMVIASRASKYASARLRWFAEHHGKSILDATFRRAREWVGTYLDLAEVENGVVTMQTAIEAAYSEGVAGNDSNILPYRLVFLRPPGHDKTVFYYGVRRLKIENTDCVYDLAAQGRENIQVNANCGSERTVKIEWAAATKKDMGGYDDSESESDAAGKVWETKQEKKTHVARIRKKFAIIGHAPVRGLGI